MRRAAKTDANQEQIVSALRAAGCSVLSLAAVGKGVPDLLVWRGPHLKPGYAIAFASAYYLMEVKDGRVSPSRRKLTGDQERFHADWQGPIVVVNSAEEALRVVGVL